MTGLNPNSPYYVRAYATNSLLTVYGNEVTFSTLETFTLTYTAGTGGTISGATPQTVDYGTGGTAITAIPDTGFHFVDWSDDSTANPRTDTNVTANVSVTANFALDTHALTVAAVNGTVAKDPDQASFDYGTIVQLTASPSTGYHFVNWSGDASGSDNPVTVTMDGDKSVTANFAIDSVPATERAALIALYNATDGDHWTNNSGWKTPPLDTDDFAMPGTEGSWFGITVNSGTLRVLYIHLNNNQLTGSMPAELGSLAGLQQLHLQQNQLTGSIPAELGNLTQLNTLWLNQNQLSGAIPAALGNISSLSNLFLGTNQLSGPVPSELGRLTNLQSLQLGQNMLSGPIPSELGDLTSLFALGLEHNQLTGSIPPQLGNLTSLTSLTLAANQLTGSIPSGLGSLTSLEYLALSSNKLSGAIPASLVNLVAIHDGWADFGYNDLYTSDETLITFLNAKDPDWATTQTIAPTGVTATSLDNAVILVSWLPIAYTGDTGSYKVLISETAGGPYTLAGETADKTTSSVNVTGLTPGQRYYFVVQTHTNAHANNQSALDSENSTEATAIAWTQLNVHISGTVTRRRLASGRGRHERAHREPADQCLRPVRCDGRRRAGRGR